MPVQRPKSMLDPDAMASLERYLDYLTKERQVSAHTIDAYQRDLFSLSEFLTELGIRDWQDVQVQHARAFPARLKRAGQAGSTIQRSLSAARSLFRYLAAHQLVASNPFEAVSAPKSGKKLPATLSVDELSELLDQHDDSPSGLRDRAVLELFYSSGLRLAELQALDFDGVDFGQREVRVLGKGSKERIVPVGSRAIDAIREWLSARISVVQHNEKAMFVNNKGVRLSTRGIQYRIEQWAKRSGIGRHLHPHMLRHSFASHVLESSGDLRAVQEMLGHADISTTQIYTHLDFQHLAKVYDDAHPRARRKPGEPPAE